MQDRFDNTLAGRRVRLIRCEDPHTELVPGEVGTIRFTDSVGTLHVTWDKGSMLGLIPGLDEWEVLSDGR